MNPPATRRPFRSLSLSEQRIKDVLPQLIALERGEELAVGEPLGQVFIRTEPLPLLPLIVASPTLLCRSYPRQEVMVRQLVEDAFLQLAIVRAWRALETEGPPASLLSTNILWNALAKTGSMAPQQLVDRIHLAIDRGRPWRHADHRKAPAPLKSFSLVPADDSEASLTGYLADGHLSITRYSKGSFSIAPHPAGSGERRQYGIEVARTTPETLAAAAVGRPASDVIEHPMITALGGTVAGVRVLRGRTRMRIRLAAPPTPWADSRQTAEFERKHLELLSRRPAVVREVLRSVAGR